MDFDAEQELTPVSICELSHDDDLFSLFHQMDSVHHRENEQTFFPSDLNLDRSVLEKGYNSECNPEDNRSSLRKHKHIFNKREKKKTKKRTKMYIEMLENRVNDLQTEIDKLKKLNKSNKQYIHRLNESEHMINGYFVSRQQMYEKLETLISGENISNQRIMEEIVSLRLRQGVYGKDRIKGVNYYFKQLVETLLPEIQKYAVSIALEKSDFFDPNYINQGEIQVADEWRRKMLESIEEQLSAAQIRAYLQGILPKVVEQSATFEKYLEGFYEMKCKLVHQARKIEEMLDGAHKVMTPLQLSKFLCYIDRYRFEKNITLEHTFKSLFEKINSDNFNYDASHPIGDGPIIEEMIP